MKVHGKVEYSAVLKVVERVASKAVKTVEPMAAL